MRRVGLVVFLLMSRMGWSQGVVFPEPGWNVWSAGQEAIYVVRPGMRARYRVALIPRVQLQGNAPRFGMLLPTPSEPTLITIGGSVFDEAARITQPLFRGSSFLSEGCGGDSVPYPVGEPEREGVTVLQEKRVGAFEVAVLSSRSSEELLRWLEEHGYSHGIEEDRLLDDYIAKGWVFTAMRFRREVLPAEPFSWQTEPLTLLYETENLLYPMRLAALSASPSDATRLRLYVVSDQRVTFDGARTRYANRISQRELERIRADAPVFGGLLSEGVFLTKLTREYSLFDSKEDFEFRHTVSREYHEVTRNPILYGTSPLVGLLLLGGLLRKRSSLLPRGKQP